MKEKKDFYKVWRRTKLEGDLKAYLVAKKTARQKVAIAKRQSCDKLCQELESKSGEKGGFRLAKNRSRRKKDVEQVRGIKDEKGKSMVDDEEICKRWEECFSKLVNEGVVGVEAQERVDGDGHGVVPAITKTEVEKALKR